MSDLDENLELSNKIQKARANKQLTLRQLAQTTKLSPSLLSQIETGKVIPSLQTLRSIAQALEVPLFTFFIEDIPTDNLIVRAGTGKKIVLPDINMEYTLLTPDLSGATEMALLRIPAFSKSSDALFSHSGEEIAYVASGEAVLYLGDNAVTLNTGDSVKILPKMAHRWENNTSSDVLIVFAVTPPSF